MSIILELMGWGIIGIAVLIPVFAGSTLDLPLVATIGLIYFAGLLHGASTS